VSRGLQHALEALYGLERRRDRHTLDGITALLAALGDPHRRFRSVHVAGTNGKGSVCALVERVLREAGHRTGLFTSPHLVDFRERIRVSGRWADEAWLERKLERIAALPEGRERTFFEVCTALAFDYFAEQQVEVAVVEVGLGGRLDCTNVLVPEVSVITTIGFDHTEILGDTLEAIAAEKAGIIKPGVPVVHGAASAPAARVIEARARELGAPLVNGGFSVVTEVRSAGAGTTASLNGPIDPPDGSALPGLGGHYLVGTPWGERVELPWVRDAFPLANLNLALAALAALPRRDGLPPWPVVRRGLASARWPGRRERCPTEPRLWWDGAHNVSGMMQLRWWRGPRPAAIVLALSADKDLKGIVQVLRWDFATARIFAARTRSARATDPAAIVAEARAAGIDAMACDEVVPAVREALAFAGDAPVLLTGSLFAVGEAMEAFGGAPGEWL
jgi:dihydrofolate synthase/folylpolyglutamate synthase